MFNECTPICRVINSMRCIFTTNFRLALIIERLAMKTWCRLLLLCIVLPTFLTACGTKDREFPGHTRDQVWKAMVQAADDPRYADWVVLENKVWRDDAQSRIEILRDVVRDVMVPGQDPKREEAEWRFSAELVNSNPPSVEFSTSTITVPAHFWLQARHYLDEVDRRLAGMPIETKSKILSYSSDHSKTAPEVSKGLPVVSTSESDARLPPEIPMSSAVSMAATSATTGAVQSSSMPQSQPLEQPAAVVEAAPTTQPQPLEQPEAVVEAAPSTPPQPLEQPAAVVEAAPTTQPQPLEQPAAVVEGEPTPVTEVEESTHSAMSKSTVDPSTDVAADPTQDQPSHSGATESERSVLTPVVVPVSEKDLQVAQSEGISETMTPAHEAIPAPEPVAQEAERPAPEPVAQELERPAPEPVAQEVERPAPEPVAQEAERPAPEPVEQINVKPAIVAQPAVVASAQKIEKPKSNLVRGPNPDTGTEKELGVGAEKVDTSSPHSTSASTSETATASTFESVNNSTAEPAVVVPSAMVSEEVGQIVDEHNSTSTGGSENSSSEEGDPSLETEPTPIVDSEPEINSQPERSPISKPAAEPVAQPEVQPAAEPEPEPASEPEVQPTAEPELAPATEPEVQPAAEPEPEPASEPVAQPTAEPEPEPVVQPAAEPEPEPASEPVVQPAPVRKTKLQPTPAPVPEPVEPSPFEPPPEP